MAKLPESERPPFKDIERRLHDRVSYQYRQLFVSDIQNDCACATESYDCDSEIDTWYLSSPDVAEKALFSNRLALPMINEISDKSILLLLKKACENVGDDYPLIDTVPTALLTNSKYNPDKLVRALKACGRDLSMNRSGIIHGVAFADFVPVDDFILLPDPEFFGALSVNIGGFGAFCFTNSIFKYKV